MIREIDKNHGDWPALLEFLQQNFAYMTPIMGHPPRVDSMSPGDLALRAASGAAFVAGPDETPVACLFVRPSRDLPGAAFLHMLAVEPKARGTGLAQRLVHRAEAYARRHGFTALTLDTGSALVELRALYRHWGFAETVDDGETVRFMRPLPSLRKLAPADPELGAVLDLLAQAFAFMDGRIDPPSSLAALSPGRLSDVAKTAEVWALGTPVQATVTLTPKADALYLGKLAVASGARRKGYARQLVEHAAFRARALGRKRLRLQTRIELTENHRAFAAMGFVKTAQTAHPGFDRPTSITMERPLG